MGHEGDEHSKYFHVDINKKRSSLAIRGVLIDGDMVSDLMIIDVISSFYADDAVVISKWDRANNLTIVFKSSLGVLRDLESLRRKNFNGADINEKRFSMISWNKILASKQKGGLGSVSSLSPWNCILKELNSLSAKGINLLALLKKKVGNGANTLFWEDCWINDVPLSRYFPRFISLAAQKVITVADKLIDAFLFEKPPWMGWEEEQLHL
ncbi:hypothetical protein Tco_1459337 [Tanacetum coccineum]